MQKYIKLSITISALLAIDLISKYFFYNQELLSQTFLFQPAFNTWVAWSVPVPYFIIYIIAILVIWLLLFSFRKNYIKLLPTALIISWTLWNIYDRIFLWWVRDFINIWELPLFWQYPIFNLADAFLFLWVVILLIYEIFPTKQKNK